ncbi:MAG TPA: trypsin-like serine protease, partial [Longimicrobiaceae bacterium]|nr:trypsin-like serine protease [Longimicrobiaceae bacterium]
MRFTKPLAALTVLATLTACSEAVTPGVSPDGQPRLIVNGTPTGSNFGNVGALLFDFDRDGVIEGLDALCTGSLISPTVFLTAAHCVSFLPADAQLYVSFDSELMPAPRNVIAAQAFHYDPQYGRDYGNLHDQAVVILPERATRGITPLRLPPAGYLDHLAAQGNLSKQLFVNVGYGTSASQTGVPHFGYDGVRKFSKSEFMGLKQNFLGLLMNNNATGEGGDCYGDSGGPKFIDGQHDMVVAIVVTGDVPCRATSWDYRMDTPSARNFLGQFVA